MTDAQRQFRRYRTLRSQGRCTDCAARLPRNYTGSRCEACRSRRMPNREMAATARKAAMEAEIAKIIATPNLTASQHAAVLGIGLDRAYHLRTLARQRGHAVMIEHRKRNYAAESERWDAVDNAERCDVCSLLKPCNHDLMPTIRSLAESRSGAAPAVRRGR